MSFVGILDLPSRQTIIGWCLTAVLTLLFLRYIWNDEKLPKRQDVGKQLPPMIPGGLFEVLSNFFSFDAPFYLLRVCRSMKTRVVSLPLLPSGRNFIVVADARLARTILEDTGAVKWPRAYRFFELVSGGDNFFSANGNRFRHVRKSTSSAFAPNNIPRMVDIIQGVTRQWISNVLEPHIERHEPLDVSQEFQRITLDIMGKVAFDYDFGKEESDEILDSFRLTYQEFSIRTPKNPLRDSFLGFMFPHVRQARQASASLRRICRGLLKHHRSQMNPNPNTILYKIVNDHGYLNDEERVRDMIAYLAGGYDTVSTTIAWTLLELARHPGEQIWLQEELSRCATLEERGQCVALRNTIRESMRLNIAPALGSLRVTSQDWKVPDSNTYIPANSIVVCPYFVIQRDEEIFDKPDEFVPRRWEGASNTELKWWMGYGVGARNCQGQALANTELTEVLAELCSNYTYSVADEGRVEYYVTLKPVGTMLSAKKVAP